MRRRELLSLVAGVAALRPFAARAQQTAMPVIGFLGADREAIVFMDPFRQGLSETGYVEGNNVAMEFRVSHGHYDLLPGLAADLVSRKVDVIVAGSTAAALAAKGATTTIPIVFISVSDPVGIGLIGSLARPGGNVTGFSDITAELMPKRLELLLELVPQAKAIALLVNPINPNAEPTIRNVQEGVRAMGVQPHILKAGTNSEIDAAFFSVVRLRASALLLGPDPFFFIQREQLIALAARYSVPTIYFARRFATVGGLISYAASATQAFRETGVYAGKILNGVRPSDLPVQQPTKFELVINLKTAKALGLTVPPSILARADEVIE